MADITPNIVVSMPSQIFTQRRAFKSCSNGKIYIGKIDTDPTIVENQIPVYLENEDGKYTPVAQPLIIGTGGYPVYDGQIAKFVTEQGHAMAVYDAYGSQEFYFPNILKYDPDQLRQELSNGGDGMGDALVAVKQPFTGSSVRTQHDKNAECITTDDAPTIDLVLLSGTKSIKCLGKSYAISSVITIPANTYLDITPGFSITGAIVTNNGDPIRRSLYSAGVPYSIGSVVIDANGNEFICTSPSHGGEPATNPSKWQALVIKAAITMSVPSIFSDLNVALTFIAKANITANVTIYCASHLSASVVFNHPYGDKITIDGGTRSTIIDFGENDGISIDGPFKLNIKNITLTGTNWTSHGVWTKVATGIFAIAGAFINCDNVLVNKIYYGFQAARGGAIYATNCEASEAGDGGFFAFNSGHIEAVNCNSHDIYDSGLVGQLGYGFVAEAGSTMWLRNPVSYGCPAGIFCNIGSSIRADDVNFYGNNNGILVKAGSIVEVFGGTVNNNIADNVLVNNARYSAINATHNISQNGSGLRVTSGSVARSKDSSFSNNPQYGVIASLSSVVDTSSSTISTGNTTGAYSPAFGTIGNNNSIIANS